MQDLIPYIIERAFDIIERTFYSLSSKCIQYCIQFNIYYTNQQLIPNILTKMWFRDLYSNNNK